jgi:hypothetical protein
VPDVRIMPRRSSLRICPRQILASRHFKRGQHNLCGRRPVAYRGEGRSLAFEVSPVHLDRTRLAQYFLASPGAEARLIDTRAAATLAYKHSAPHGAVHPEWLRVTAQRSHGNRTPFAGADTVPTPTNLDREDERKATLRMILATSFIDRSRGHRGVSAPPSRHAVASPMAMR